MEEDHVWGAHVAEQSCVTLILTLDGALRKSQKHYVLVFDLRYFNLLLKQCGKMSWTMSMGEREKVRQGCGSQFKQKLRSIFCETLAKHPCSGFSLD